MCEQRIFGGAYDEGSPLDRPVYGALMLADSRLEDPLDRYIEAHVHGGVAVPEDAEVLVLDPCYAGTDLEMGARSAGLTV